MDIEHANVNVCNVSIGKSSPFFTAFLSMSFGNASKRILLLVVNFKKIYKVY